MLFSTAATAERIGLRETIRNAATTIRAPIHFHIPISGEVIPPTLTADYTDFSD